ncbi:glycosyltransferase [Thermotoga sp. SG1]|uniref:glycosyltransferase n=1 Tax=Thermotoga sp. SG1 TaxID=126739 RepID=UPI001E4C1783|nr:glycosyltransferase [Thermotoga sp. SG1]
MKKQVLRIAHGRPLPNSEINRAYKESFCIWNVYRRSTQSGVLPKAYMFGTPVIANDIGSFLEFVRPEETGKIISLSVDLDEILKNVLEIRKDIDKHPQKAHNFS